MPSQDQGASARKGRNCFHRKGSAGIEHDLSRMTVASSRDVTAPAALRRWRMADPSAHSNLASHGVPSLWRVMGGPRTLLRTCVKGRRRAAPLTTGRTRGLAAQGCSCRLLRLVVRLVRLWKLQPPRMGRYPRNLRHCECSASDHRVATEGRPPHGRRLGWRRLHRRRRRCLEQLHREPRRLL